MMSFGPHDHKTRVMNCAECLASELAEARAENERLKAWWSHAFKPGCASQGWELQCSMTAPDGLRHCGYAPELHPLDAQPLKVRDCEARIAELESRIAESCRIQSIDELRARIAELEADVVWIGYNGFQIGPRYVSFGWESPYKNVTRHDGTHADILRAVREARDGVS